MIDTSELAFQIIKILDPHSCYGESVDELESALEADRNAVRLSLLDELEARAAGMITYPLREQVEKQRQKYTPPRGIS